MTTVSVHPTAEDYQATERAIVRRLTQGVPRMAALRWAGVAPAAMVAFGLIALTKAEYPPWVNSNVSAGTTLGLLTLGLVLLWVWARVCKVLAARHLYRPGSPLLQPFSLEVGDQHLLVETAGASSRLAWARVEHIEREAARLLIFIGPAHALPVPEHSFASRAEFEAFGAQIEARRGQAEA